MLIVLAALAFLAITLLPQALVRLALRRHGVERSDLPGTGGELARHLLDHHGIEGVGVEVTDRGDHYDPATRTVRLLPSHHDGRSIAAVAVAAHEVGHAIQHARGEKLLSLRQKLAGVAATTDRLAGVFFIAAPILAILARTPLALAALLGVGLVLMGVRVVFALITLPVEYDASWGKALPILKAGRYLDEGDLPAARNVLRAAAYTYVASALVALVNIARWVRLLR